MEKYWLIHCNEDGEVRVDCVTKETLLSRLDEKYYGDVDFFGPIVPRDPQEWGRRMLILKGDVVAPFAKETVVKYDVK